MHPALTPEQGASRKLFVSGDSQILIEGSAQFVNVRVSCNGGEPVAIPAEIAQAVALGIAQAGTEVASHAAREAAAA